VRHASWSTSSIVVIFSPASQKEESGDLGVETENKKDRSNIMVELIAY